MTNYRDVDLLLTQTKLLLPENVELVVRTASNAIAPYCLIQEFFSSDRTFSATSYFARHDKFAAWLNSPISVSRWSAITWRWTVEVSENRTWEYSKAELRYAEIECCQLSYFEALRLKNIRDLRQ